MNHRTAFAELRYRGRVRSVRRDYHVLEGSEQYVVLSPRADGAGGNYNVVTRRALNYVLKRLGGTKSIATSEAFAECKRSRYIGDRFTLLNALYVLMAIEKAWISKRRGRKLFFGIRKGTV